PRAQHRAAKDAGHCRDREPEQGHLERLPGRNEKRTVAQPEVSGAKNVGWPRQRLEPQRAAAVGEFPRGKQAGRHQRAKEEAPHHGRRPGFAATLGWRLARSWTSKPNSRWRWARKRWSSRVVS